MSPIQTSTNIAQAIIIKKMFKCAIAITSPNPGWEHDFFSQADCGFVPFPKYFEKKFRPASYRIPNSTWRI